MARTDEPSVQAAASPALAEYVAAVVAACASYEPGLASVILFGSTVTGGYRHGVSDVDMMLVLHDDADARAAADIRQRVEAVESAAGLRDEPDATESAVAHFARRLSANVRSFFICSRSDLLSGEPARILGIPRAQALFVDRAVLPSLISSARTAWGEELLPLVPLLPIRRLDVFKAWFSQFNQVLLNAALYAFVPNATKYAMDALKRSVHNCYFCYTLSSAALADEIAFLQARGRLRALDDLLQLRQQPSRSFGFVLRCAPALVLLHARTALQNEFPRLPETGGALSGRL
jgi:predicted nucleotidyltransferase